MTSSRSLGEAAYAYHCPTCHAAPGVVCRQVPSLRTCAPHARRRQLAETRRLEAERATKEGQEP